MSVIEPRRVDEIFGLISWNPSRDGANFVEVEAISTQASGQPRLVRFNQQRLRRYMHEIDVLIDNLHDDFRSRNGAPFIGADRDKNGDMWVNTCNLCAREHLILLGIAVGRVAYTERRALWNGDHTSNPRIVICAAH